MWKWLFLVFAALYIFAILLLLVGTFGLFGQQKDPLSAVFLLPLGLPWNLLADQFKLANAITLIAAPAINVVILLYLWRRSLP